LIEILFTLSQANPRQSHPPLNPKVSSLAA